MAAFWSAALGYRAELGDDGSAKLYRFVDVGQSDQDPFVVLADPEGNEFCVLRRETRSG